MIPARYSRQGGNNSPPLAWTDLPPGTQDLALVADDPDAPSGTFVHWLLYHIPSSVKSLEEGLGSSGELQQGLKQGRNGFGEIGYGGPQPPKGTHRYYFHLYALDRDLNLPLGADRKDFDRAIRGHVLGEAKLMGRYRS